MTIEKLERANNICYRIKELEKMKSWLIKKERNIYVISSGEQRTNDCFVSDTMRDVMLNACDDELKTLKSELNEM